MSLREKRGDARRVDRIDRPTATGDGRCGAESSWSFLPTGLQTLSRDVIPCSIGTEGRLPQDYLNAREN